MFLCIRLVKVDVGLRVVHVDESVAHGRVSVVLISREPVAVRRAPEVALRAPLCALFPAALPGVDPNYFLILEGDAAMNPGKCLKREREKILFKMIAMHI